MLCRIFLRFHVERAHLWSVVHAATAPHVIVKERQNTEQERKLRKVLIPPPNGLQKLQLTTGALVDAIGNGPKLSARTSKDFRSPRATSFL